MSKGFTTGDRVRICRPESEYTGCRGTITDGVDGQPEGVTPLGHFVAVDGENGLVRPFLIQDLALLRPASVRPTQQNTRQNSRQSTRQHASRPGQASAPRKASGGDTEPSV
jgi:hypothetical protein